MARLLLAEDNRQLVDWLVRLLRQDNYVVDCVYRGDDADSALTTGEYAVVILDVGLPGLDGIEVTRRLRARGDRTPIIILTANDALSSRVKGLDSGADDYLVKPFDIEELEARIRAQLRRGAGLADNTTVFGPLSFNAEARQFSVDGTALSLTPREHAVLETLIMRAGRPVPKDSLAASVFGLDDDIGPNAIELCVHRVRRKLEGTGVSIATLRGLGYMLRKNNAG